MPNVIGCSEEVAASSLTAPRASSSGPPTRAVIARGQVGLIPTRVTRLVTLGGTRL